MARESLECPVLGARACGLLMCVWGDIITQLT